MKRAQGRGVWGAFEELRDGQHSSSQRAKEREAREREAGTNQVMQGPVG